MKFVSVALIAGAFGCTLVQPVLAVEDVKARERVLHSFVGGADGAAPTAGLTDWKGTLYGMTAYGGPADGGTVFAVDPKTGAEDVLYSFCSEQNCVDGSVGGTSLTAADGLLYGTTVQGGSTDICGFNHELGCGTVFAVNPGTGAEKVLYSFCSQQNCTDGETPESGLLNVKNTLYGTTYFGGTSQYDGVVFSIDAKTGKEKVVYGFCSRQNCTDGGNPEGNLISVSGTIYGITYGGGNAGDGTVFAFDPETGTEKVLYSFCSQQDCADGSEPEAGLVAANGTLYGTTSIGGAHNLGTVFAVNLTTGAETVLYSFCSKTNCDDGSYPQASLIDVKGMLYGTAAFGGKNCKSSNTCGTVFAVDPSTETESVLYDFCGEKACKDGGTPGAGLIDVKNVLYGTTQNGGIDCADGGGGCGVVFALKPH
ncbi:MAG TPA: choice-of-anchor tandem repeat GloVer-containing protein [Rhizomicrobium sp.]|jgi:uncharacterized repeat protein (TIGR03803 family)|nr:choice-of-anchor tandem repeat GloVer-containing protein [Rhizomicrobium sp.]